MVTYIIPIEIVEQKIYLVRGHKVMLDRDLAELYAVETRVGWRRSTTRCL